MFLVLVVLFIWAYFRQWKMSVAALVALVHDIIITVGVFALSRFEVTPATVTGLLTILGFSLYDTVVVFDKVRENTKNLRATRQTYAQAANLAVNQTLVRSINTSIVALIPIGAILYVGALQLGASSLKDLALALFVGIAAGIYSSIFIATPLLVHLKSGETEVVLAERRAKARARREADRVRGGAVVRRGHAGRRRGRRRPARSRSTTTTTTSTTGPRVAPSRAPEAVGRGRTVPTTTATGRQQLGVGSPAAEPAAEVQARQEVGRGRT